MQPFVQDSERMGYFTGSGALVQTALVRSQVSPLFEPTAAGGLTPAGSRVVGGQEGGSAAAFALGGLVSTVATATAAATAAARPAAAVFARWITGPSTILDTPGSP